jgi:L,D-transpeptidase YcbB
MSRYFSKIVLLLLSANGFLWFACTNDEHTQAASSGATAQSPGLSRPKDLSLAGNFSDQQTAHFDSAAITHFLKNFPLFRSLDSDMRKFYVGRNFAYAWYDKDGLVDQAENLYNHVLNIQEEGLPADLPYRDLFSSTFDVYDRSMQARTADHELFLTAEYFTYAHKVWGGIAEEKTKSMDWFLPRKKMDAGALLDSLLLDSGSTIMDRGYTFRQYGLLKNFLKRYRDLQKKDPWTRVATPSKTLRQGDSSQIILEIRQRLYKLEDLSENNGRPRFDAELQKGIENFQTRMGQNPDGLITPALVARLNLPIEEDILKIIVNMERSRWVPLSLSHDYLIVNIPAFQLFAFESDSLIFTMKVVVGKALHKTVIFNGDLKTIVFSPYWNVPPDIMKKEILPAIRKNPDYLKKQHMEWNGGSVRQLPGPHNALGEVKFLFPNSYHIYLHDSPAKSLFNQNVRAFSHGCIRVAEPKKLAMYLLRDQPSWSETRIQSAMKSKKEQWVPLKKPEPVFIAYLSAWVDSKGRLNLRDDIYNRDHRLGDELLNLEK